MRDRQVGDGLGTATVTIAASDTAQPLSQANEAHESTLSVMLRARIGNAADIKIGDEQNQTYPLHPDEVMTIDITKRNQIWFLGTKGDAVDVLFTTTSKRPKHADGD